MATKTAKTSAVLNALEIALTSGPASDSVHDYLERGIGEPVSKAATMNVNNGTTSVNLFTVTGSIQVLKLWGVLTTATTLTNCTNLHFDIYDGSAATAITKNTGTTLSGLAVGTTVVKTELSASNLTLMNNATGVLSEASVTKGLAEFFLAKKTGVTTYVRLTYTSTDTPANAVMTVYAEYRKLSSDGALTAV